MERPGYLFQNGKDAMAAIAKYVTAVEWKELASGANQAHNRYAATSNPCVMGLLYGTCGVCFCPLMCYGCFVDVEAKANADIAQLPVTHKLKERGIALHFIPKTSQADGFDMGGMHCTLSVGTTPTVQQMSRQDQPAAAGAMEVTVPEGVAAGQAIAVQMPSGALLQAVVPDGLKAGDKFMITT